MLVVVGREKILKNGRKDRERLRGWGGENGEFSKILRRWEGKIVDRI